MAKDKGRGEGEDTVGSSERDGKADVQVRVGTFSVGMTTEGANRLK